MVCELDCCLLPQSWGTHHVCVHQIPFSRRKAMLWNSVMTYRRSTDQPLALHSGTRVGGSRERWRLMWRCAYHRLTHSLAAPTLIWAALLQAGLLIQAHPERLPAKRAPQVSQ